MTAVHVFLGPSLSWEEARKILPEATLLPPAQVGDVYAAVKRNARAIAIIDGFFEQVPAVWHKEVLYALSRGVHVFGASSMGALRAAELHPFGMVGVGRVFEAYRDGVCEDDDEVAVVHRNGDDGFESLSEALVNVRDGLSQALGRGLIGQATHDAVLHAMKGRYYAERSWALVPEIAKAAGLPRAEADALLAFVRTERPNRKRMDAIELLTQLRRFEQDPPLPFEPSFEFESTVFWDRLVATVRTGPGASAEVPIDALRRHVGVVEDDAVSIFHGSLLMYLVVKEARRLGLVLDKEKVERVSATFRHAHGLTSPAATEEWLQRNRLAPRELAALMEVLALIDAVAEYHSTGLDAFLPAELQRRGRFESVAAAVLAKRRVLADFGLAFPSPEDVGTTAEALLAWYKVRYRELESSLENHRASRRVPDPNQFLREVLAEYLRQGLHRKGTVVSDA
jgi:hypothetical protein